MREGEEIRIGKVVLRIMETPGHTPESMCVLITDTEVSDQTQKILTGDTLFIGDVGRPDLAGGQGYTPQMMAGQFHVVGGRNREEGLSEAQHVHHVIQARRLPNHPPSGT